MRRQEMSLLLGVLVAALLREAGAATCFPSSSLMPLCSETVCNAVCSEADGCLCSLPGYVPCLPSECHLTTADTCCPLGLFWRPDLSCCSETNICAASTSSQPLCLDDRCNGQCNEGSGCYCTAGDIIPCLPSECHLTTPADCCPTGLFWHPNHSCCSDVLNCAPACASDEVCTNNAGTAECTCNSTTYLHANRSELIPTIKCESSQMTVSFKKCLLERFKYSITGMHFMNASGLGCTDPAYEEFVEGERWIRAQAIPQTGSCGSVMTINTADKKLTFSNALYVPPDTSGGLAVSSALNISFSCTYNMTMQTSLLTALHPILGTVTLPSVNGSGTVTATMAAYMTNAFTTPYTQANTLTVGDTLYIGIYTEFSNGDMFTLRAEKCVAAPTNNPDVNSVLLISGGCAVTEDVDVQIIHNGVSLQVMFQISTFVFKDQSEVYMSCDVSLCQTTTNNCGCSGTRSAPPETATIRMDPIGISASLTFNSGSHTDISLWAVLGSSLLALLSLKMI